MTTKHAGTHDDQWGDGGHFQSLDQVLAAFEMYESEEQTRKKQHLEQLWRSILRNRLSPELYATLPPWTIVLTDNETTTHAQFEARGIVFCLDFRLPVHVPWTGETDTSQWVVFVSAAESPSGTSTRVIDDTSFLRGLLAGWREMTERQS